MPKIELDVTGLSHAAIEDIRSHVRSKQDGPDTYDYELGSGWRCFHCGEMFRTWGGASLHFGKPADAKPICFEGTKSAAVAWRCPHDMGFDNELGPIGCRLIGQELECVCENAPFSPQEPKALRAAAYAIRAATIEECAKTADKFTCGICGMDGSAGAAI